MNRELKFRVWNKDLRCFWKESEILGITVDGKIIAKFDERCTAILDKSAKDNIIQKFTDLKDSGGKEIYEGDVIEFSLKDFKQIYQVYWNQEMLRWDYASLKDNIEDPCACEYNLFERNFSNAKIVGNIFESPELFKECKPIR